MTASTCDSLLQQHTDRLKAATQHEFLKRVAEGGADKAFSRWLIQDFHFVNGYIQFLGIILGRISADAPVETAEGLTTGFLTALIGMTKEALFFRDQAKLMGIELGYTEESFEDPYRKYITYLHKLGREGTLAEVLVAFWAVEKVYLDSWVYASEHIPLTGPNTYGHFIKHWANPEFSKFVSWLADIANEAAPAVTPEMTEIVRFVIEIEVECWEYAMDRQGGEQRASR
ncbi:hypothetical protein DFS34DRAFT_611679 [Phlyctochytrium arcticum]|nr:hypothetical protein DFS34DRAFT_611679 [Phlyctochytrium arcticum]